MLHQGGQQQNSSIDMGNTQHNTSQSSQQTEEAIEKAGIGYYTSPLGEDTYFVLFNAWHEIAVIGFFLISICVCNLQVCTQIKRSSAMKDR